MGTKVTIDALGNPSGSSFTTDLNNDLDKLGDEFDKVVYRDGSFSMSGDLNFNSKRIFNLGAGANNSDAATVGQVTSIATGILGNFSSTDVTMLVPVATRTALAALTTTNVPVFLTEAGREGIFEFTTANVQTQATADTNKAIYVPPTGGNGSTGAWVRKFYGPYNPTWFGVSETNSGAVNRSALQDMYDFLYVVATQSSGSLNPYRGGGWVLFPAGIFNIVGAIDIRSTVHTQGAGPARYGSGATTLLQWNDTSSGFRVQAINTSGDATYDGVNHGGGDGSTFSDLWLNGGSAATYVYGTETGDYHGIHFKARIECRSVVVTNWSGNGFHSYAIAGAHSGLEGNANCWRLLFCEAVGCRNGLFLDGADTNAGISIGFNGTSCRQAGIYDSSFLANEHHGFHMDANGTTEYSMATFSGRVFSVIAGQEVWCSTHSPPGSATSNQGWRYHANGGVGQYGARAWVSGQTWRTGGPIITDNSNAYHEFSGYTEGGQPPSQFTYPTKAQGGQYAGMIEYGSVTAYGGNIAGTGAGSKGLRTALDLQVGRDLTVAGEIDLSTNSLLPYSGGGQCAILRDATHGMIIYSPNTGATNCFRLFAGGAGVLAVPNGSNDALFDGNVSVGGGKVFKVNGTQVVGARQVKPATPTLDDVVACLVAHGLWA
jgi:hypothetical protein